MAVRGAWVGLLLACAASGCRSSQPIDMAGWHGLSDRPGDEQEFRRRLAGYERVVVGPLRAAEREAAIAGVLEWMLAEEIDRRGLFPAVERRGPAGEGSLVVAGEVTDFVEEGPASARRLTARIELRDGDGGHVLLATSISLQYTTYVMTTPRRTLALLTAEKIADWIESLRAGDPSTEFHARLIERHMTSGW